MNGYKVNAKLTLQVAHNWRTEVAVETSCTSSLVFRGVLRNVDGGVSVEEKKYVRPGKRYYHMVIFHFQRATQEQGP